MDQPILSTKKSQYFAHPAISGPDRGLGRSGILGNLHITDAQCRALLVGVDALMLLTSLYAAWRFAHLDPTTLASIALPELDFEPLNRFWVAMLLGTWFLVGWLTDLYDLRFAHARGLTAARIAVAAVASVSFTWFYALRAEAAFPRAFLLYYLVIGASLVVAWRLSYAALTKTSLFVRNILVLGTDENARMVAKLFNQAQGFRYAMAGYVAETPGFEAKVCGDLPVWRITTSLLDLVRDLQVDTIVAAVKDKVGPALYAELIACQSHGINILSVPAIYHQLCQKVPVEYVDSSWLLEPIQSSSSKLRWICKRVLDLSVSLLALPWLLLAFPLIALAIKLNSPGPIFYRQVRSGLGGKPFQILKFRTMFVDAEKDGKARWAAKDDPRITRVGKHLRKLRLDELPQFINILRGEMSLIGPRPERPEFVAELEKEIPYYCTRLLVPPGLTGWAQIKYTYGNSVEDALIKLQYDVYYVHHWSVWMDIYILFQTVNVVLRAKGT